MRDSNSSRGYTVLNGLVCMEARIAVGELSMVPVARAGSTMVHIRTIIVNMILSMFRWDLCLDTTLLGGWVLTEELFFGFSLYASGLAAGELVFDLTTLGELTANRLFALSCPAEHNLGAALLTKLAVPATLT